MEHCLNMIASLPSSSLVECLDQVDIVLWKEVSLSSWYLTSTNYSRHYSYASHAWRPPWCSMWWGDEGGPTTSTGIPSSTNQEACISEFHSKQSNMSPEWQLKTLLQMRSHWMKSQKESLRLEEAGLTGDVLDSAISSFILEARIIYL